MTSLSCTSGYVSLTCGMKTFIVRLHDNDLTCIEHKHILGRSNPNFEDDASKTPHDKQDLLKTLQFDNDDLGLGLLSSDISRHGNLLAFCTNTKQLCIVDLSQPKPIITKVYQLSRGASKVKFTPISENVIVADKSGDVQLFHIKKEDNKGQLVLGHLSLLLDFLVTPDEELIITCDRDEKIRVSCFPNGYNIIAYCLGHLEFVSSLGFLPHNNSYLFSTSGDGTVRFWDFKQGSELMTCDAFSHISSDGTCNIDDNDVAAITDSESIFVNDKTSLICVCIENLRMCMTLKCVTENEKLQYSICQYIPFDDLSPWRVHISLNILWIVLNSDEKSLVKTMIFNCNTCCFEDNLSDNIAESAKLLNNQKMSTDFKKNIVNLLFKRKFDNVKDYLRKKDARFALTSSEPCIKKNKN